MSELPSIPHVPAKQIAPDLWLVCDGRCVINSINADAGATYTLYDGDPRGDGTPILRLQRGSGRDSLWLSYHVHHGCYYQGATQAALVVASPGGYFVSEVRPT